LAGIFVASAGSAGGLLPDQINQIIIQGRFTEATPGFLAVFSAQPLQDGPGKLRTGVTAEAIAKVTKAQSYVGVRLYGKPASEPGRFDYFFGTAHDADRPWNNGQDFRWQDWETVSPDVWDNVSIVALPPDGGSRRAPAGIITDVTIRRGGKMLYDSRTKQSYPNKRPIDPSFKPFSIAPVRGRYPLLNLAERMARFRNDYYELGDNAILSLAYSDLGQTEKSKYANRGKNWCSEFASYVYRQNGLLTPDPNTSDVHWKNMREFFEANGQVYTLRETLTWSNQDKIAKIKPGSFVSILIGEATHSLIFTTWILDGLNPITQYTALSGTNKSMVWSHAPLKLPTPEQLQGLSPEQLADFDQKVYFGVPGRP
jgi:hypothetical protein